MKLAIYLDKYLVEDVEAQGEQFTYYCHRGEYYYFRNGKRKVRIKLEIPEELKSEFKYFSRITAVVK